MDTTGCRLILRATEKSTLGTPEEFQEGVYRDPGKLPCIFGLLRGNANAKFKFYKSWTRRGRNSQSHLSNEFAQEKTASASADAVFRKLGLYYMRTSQ